MIVTNSTRHYLYTMAYDLAYDVPEDLLGSSIAGSIILLLPESAGLPRSAVI